MKEIELFKSLNFSNNVDYKKHMFNIQQNHTYFIIQHYLEFIGNYDISTKNFLILITIYYYNNEFNTTDEEKNIIQDYINKYNYINNNIELDKQEYYKYSIKKYNKDILELLNTILERTSNNVLNHYSKMYYFYNNLNLEIKNEEITKEKNMYLKSLKLLLDDNINISDYIKKKENLNR